MVSGLPNENVVVLINQSQDLSGQIELEQAISDLKDGWYQLRVLVYDNDNSLITISNAQEFFITTEFIEESLPAREEEPTNLWVGPIAAGSTIVVIFLILLIFFRKKKREEQENKFKRSGKFRRP